MANGVDPDWTKSLRAALNGGISAQSAQQAVASWRAKYPQVAELFPLDEEIMAREQSASRVHRGGVDIKTLYTDIDSHIGDALSHQTVAKQQWVASTPTREKTLADFSNASLVMEMIARGYAVMKLPGDGGPPEVLR